MAARKGIKAKIIARVMAEPNRVWTGDEIEVMYREYGGNVVDSPRYSKARRGRVHHDTMKRLINQLPVARLSLGNPPRGRGGHYAKWYGMSTFRYNAAHIGRGPGPNVLGGLPNPPTVLP